MQYKIVHITICCVLHICIVIKSNILCCTQFYAFHNTRHHVILCCISYYATYHTMLWDIQNIGQWYTCSMQCELFWSLVTLTSQSTQTFHIWHLTFDINSPPDKPAHTLGSWQGHSKVVQTTQPGNWPLKTDNKSNIVTDWKKSTVKNNTTNKYGLIERVQ